MSLGENRLRTILPITGKAYVVLGMLSLFWLTWWLLTKPCPDGCKGGAVLLITLCLVVGLGVVQLTTWTRLASEDLRWLRPLCVVFYLLVMVLLFPFSLLLLLSIPPLVQLLDRTKQLGRAWVVFQFPLAILGLAMAPLLLLAIRGLVQGYESGIFWIIFSVVIGPGSLLAALGLRAAMRQPAISPEVA